MSEKHLEIQPDPAPPKEDVVQQEAANEAKAYVHNAARGTENEHELSLREAVRKYPAAIAWTVVVCCAW